MSKKEIRHIPLNEIQNPDFLKDLSFDELNVLANDLRQEIIKQTSINGGHLSSNLGVVELTIALERFFDMKKDKLIFDVGHQCYTHKILTGRSLKELRKENGVSGFQKMCESEFDCYEAGHSSTSISAANGFALARDLNKENFNVCALIGDGSIVSGLAMEALNNLGHSKHKVIIVLNDNGMSISKPVGGLSKVFSNISTIKGYNVTKGKYQRFMNKTLVGRKIFSFTSKIKNFFKRILVQSNIFTELGFAYVGPVDGHNIKAITAALKRATNASKPVIIHASTLKGKGYSFAENDVSGYWHGVSPFDIETGKALKNNDGSLSWSNVYASFCEERLKNDKKVVLISPATEVGAGLDKLFRDADFRNRAIDVGIAEEHAVTMSSGLAIGGFHPVISVYSTFMQRAYDEISHDLARMNLNATFLVDRAGLVGNDGETHQGIYDEAYLASIPNVVVTMASNIDEAKYLFNESFNNHGSFFIRLPRLSTKVSEPKNINLEYGKWIYLNKSLNKKTAIIGVGPLVRELEQIIKDESLDITLINALFVNPIDKNTLNELMDYEQIVVYDPYSTQGGLPNLVMAYLLLSKYKGAVSAYFVPNEFVKQATINQQLEKYHLLPRQILSDLEK